MSIWEKSYCSEIISCKENSGEFLCEEKGFQHEGISYCSHEKENDEVSVHIKKEVFGVKEGVLNRV